MVADSRKRRSQHQVRAVAKSERGSVLQKRGDPPLRTFAAGNVERDLRLGELAFSFH